jgi:hypothetical protein
VYDFGEKVRRKRTTKCRWEDNFEMGLREVRWVVMDWINLAQDGDQSKTLLNTGLNLLVP